ncbi:MAG TPA: hypothetical protein VK066_16205 [Chloroflexota bacterium]|nr:hypothetical protein [Chloroflexota bacterium]
MDQLAPPHLSEIPGRYIALAGLVGVLLWLASGLTLLCLALPLCIGTVVEVVLGGDQLQLLHCYRQARGVWHAAYYCATHDRVFLPDDGQMLVPAEFARLLGSDGPTLARPGAATVDAR